MAQAFLANRIPRPDKPPERANPSIFPLKIRDSGPIVTKRLQLAAVPQRMHLMLVKGPPTS
jgi:hypothetical protein